VPNLISRHSLKKLTENNKVTSLDLNQLLSRIDELETKTTFQQESIDNLNDVITDQWKIIDHLKLQISKLDDQLYELEISSSNGSANQKPPHY
jgi:uncharacterized coiled-coil protein SlyX